jgi:hypothetical protein
MLSPSTPVGAFTNVTIAAINAALAQAGLVGTTGNVYYCDPVNGLDTNDGQTPAVAPGGHGPVQSLGAGYNLLRSGFNDVLVLMSNGTSTGSARLAAGFTWSKNAAHLIGVCAPSAVSQRARIAPFTAATQAAFANFFTVSGNGCLFSNISWFHGFTVGIAAEICMTISGSRNAFVNCDFEGMGDAVGAASSTSRNILFTGGQENYFGHCNIGLDTVQRTTANASVEFQTGSTRNLFENCTFIVDSGDGDQFIFYAAAAGAMDRWSLFRNCAFINAIQSGATAIVSLASLPATVGGMLVLQDCIAVGFTNLGNANAVGQMYVYGPAASSSAYLSDNPAS